MSYMNKSILSPEFDELTTQANAFNDIRCLLSYLSGSLEANKPTPVIVNNPLNYEGSFIGLVTKNFALPTKYRENPQIPFVITDQGVGCPIVVQDKTLKGLGLEEKHIRSFKTVEPKKYQGINKPFGNVVIVYPDSELFVGAIKANEILSRDNSSIDEYYLSLKNKWDLKFSNFNANF